MSIKSENTSIKTENPAKPRSGKQRLTAIVAGAAISAASLLAATLARASTTITRRSGQRITSWSEIATSSGSGINISDATLDNTGPAGTGSRGDAFDGALNLYVGTPSGLSSGNPSTSTEVLIDPPGATVVNNSPNGGSVSGTASATLNGTSIGVVWNLIFSASAARVDGNFVVTNNSASTFDGYVGVYTNFGSDSSTVIEATSSGDTTIADGDTWVVTSEGSGESDGDDPVILSVIGNSNAVIGPSTDLNAGSDDLVWRVPVSLAAGASTTITASHCLFETIAEAKAAGLSGSCAREAVAVPVMQNPALLALAILTGLLGTGSLASRRKKVKK